MSTGTPSEDAKPAVPSWHGAEARSQQGPVEVPLFKCPVGAPDAWHEVMAPGGYEYWRFDGEDATHNTQFVAIFFEGLALHPAYLKRYWRFRRRPTRTKPPLPGDFPAVYFAVYREGRVAGQWLNRYRPDEFEASDSELAVRIGPNRISVTSEGSINLILQGTPWENTRRGSRRAQGFTLEATLAFKPVASHEPLQLDFGVQRGAGASIAVSKSRENEPRAKQGISRHHWILINPRCDVAGEIRLKKEGESNEEKTKRSAGVASSAPMPRVAPFEIPFWGRGYHDHQFGTAPPAVGIRQWIRGHVLLEDRCLAFTYLRPVDRKEPIETHLVEESASGIKVVPMSDASADEWKQTHWLLRYPGRMRFGVDLRLQNPRLLAAYPHAAQVVYDATYQGQTATALVEVLDPRRTGWPFLRGIVRKAIDRVS